MPVRVFSEDEKLEIREKLLSVGFPMLKQYGMIHMSIPKIAEAAGIGTGTFYRFFKSKEEYVYQIIMYQREKLLSEVITEDVRNGKRKLSKEEVRQIISLIVDKDRSVYANLTLEEENKLFGSVDAFAPSVEKEKNVSATFMNLIEQPRQDLDFPVVANLIKVLAITSQARNELHEEGYERTLTLLIDTIMNELYE